MFLMQGPHPMVQSSIVLPSPLVGNTTALTSSVQILRTASGKRFSYVKAKRGRKKLRFDFTMSRDKSAELAAFVKLCIGKAVKVTDHDDKVYIGYITLNPFELQGRGRAQGKPGNEIYSTSIELEEKV